MSQRVLKPAARRVYPWERWTDGRVHKLARGVHFATSASVFCKVALRYASTHGLHVETSRRGDVAWLLLEPGGSR